MKKVLLLALLLTVGMSFGQETKKEEVTTRVIKTTAEEYNYLTKGIKTQSQNGLDRTKNGYEFGGKTKLKVGQYNFIFTPFIKTVTNDMVAISVEAHSNVSGKDYYLCIPRGNNQLYKNYYTAYSSWDDTMTDSYVFAFSQIMMNDKSFIKTLVDWKRNETKNKKP